MERSNEPMQEGQSRTALKKLGHVGADIERIMPCMPSLQGRAGHVKLLGSLALGDTLSLEVEIVLEQVGPLEAVPELVTIDMVMVRKSDPSAHHYLSL